MKALATRTIVLILVGLLVLGIVGMLIYLGVGPFKDTSSYNICKTRLVAYCTGTGVADWDADSGCSGESFKGHKPFCSGDCYKTQADQGNCGGITDESTMHCCNYM